jgi:carbon monoxide dehydrogenase subunit G
VPETEYSTTATLPVAAIWEFVRDMDNWAPFVAGYQSHRKEGETDSRWVLKGDVGVLTRTLEFRVHVTEWAGPERVAFEIEGLNEPLRGAGEFRMEPWRHDGAQVPRPASKRGGVASLVEALARLLFRLLHGRVRRVPGREADAGQALAKLSFRLRLDPGGPMAPMVGAMMKPALGPAAEDLANKIVAHLEAAQGRR